MGRGQIRTTTRADVPPPLGYRAALDGVRAAAIAAVMLTHLNLSLGGGGVIGVDVFFVLSGFLITTLLLEERARWHRVAVAKFYGRRALRLLPALAFVLAGVVGYALIVAPTSERSDMLHEAL